ncbi:23S rRNA (adenine(2503)-C(2))-methyltransferase RlmN [Natronincola ferrireducens]|uniref:Probable dual-specificity RNA methyltransferase RlmN n=1 Tax=Natronincola ferrireducens TaxID=393762 RepID=A0A1G9BUB2_9FIRM|nr:23S rRNA (adenine(2503)-C(2))-methyltransferase RlmN [Natronincola ferrireducens]SDK43051.1 23S rRNA m(2)A-2503 methyltransferase [Natronincola ferrireducens]
MEKLDLLSLSLEETQDLIDGMGEKKYRGKQIFQWVNKGIKDFEDMMNIPKALRERLQENTFITHIQMEKKLISNIDNTRKYLFLLDDGNIIEAVVMRYKHGLTACISSQVGCLMGCSFCASTKGGLIRNLRAGEMMDQILLMQKDLNERISNIVLMGSGEPLHNYQEVIKFLKIVNNENGLNIGNRHITLSTCGLIPEIKKLADLQIPINLAISLHAPNDGLRQQMMPIAKKYNIKELIEACKYYLEKNNRRITFEYALVKGVNDEENHAHQLSELLKGMLCHVNLIPVNTVVESNYEKSSNQKINLFQKVLKERGIETTIRREMGSDINAACGQLRNNYLNRD